MLWLWRRPAATALIQPLAWELPYVIEAAVKRKRKKKENIKNRLHIIKDILLKFSVTNVCICIITHTHTQNTT